MIYYPYNRLKCIFLSLFRKEYEGIDEEKIRRKYLMLIHNIENETPFTAYNLFNMDKSLISTAFTTTLTYLIILLQFNLCNSTDTKAGQK